MLETLWKAESLITQEFGWSQRNQMQTFNFLSAYKHRTDATEVDGWGMMFRVVYARWNYSIKINSYTGICLQLHLWRIIYEHVRWWQIDVAQIYKFPHVICTSCSLETTDVGLRNTTEQPLQLDTKNRIQT